MSLKTATCSLLLVLMIHTGASYAAQVAQECAADRFVKCPFFKTSRTIGEHTPIIDNLVAGFTRSKGKWTIHVGYGPPEKCAKVSLLLNMGPIDSLRKYERVFVNGGGAISDSGSFMHKVDDLGSALRIVSSDCRVPAPDSRQEDAEKRERQALEEERRERERRRFAAERRERERRRLAEERRERERKRLARQRREQESNDVLAEMLSIQKEAAVGIMEDETKYSAETEDEIIEAGRVAIEQGWKNLMDMSRFNRPSTPSRGSPSDRCQRIANRIASGMRLRSTGDMCSISQEQLRILQNAKHQLSSNRCYSGEYDRVISQTRAYIARVC